MKIFYKKDYERALEEINRLKIQKKAYSDVIEENKKLNEELETSKLNELNLKDKLKIQEKKIEVLNKEKKALEGAKGGFIKRINELKKANENFQKKLEEYVSNRYLVRKVPSGRTPKGQKMKVTKTVSPKINNYMRKESSEE